MIQMCTVLCVLLIPSVIAEAADPVNVGSSKQLFIDDVMIASSQRIELNMNRPARTGVATIKGDRPWEQLGVSIGSIVQAGDEYRMYYSASYQYPGNNEPSRRLCMAISKDGINWEKPSLGLVVQTRSANTYLRPSPFQCR